MTRGQGTIFINGRHYDAATGRPVAVVQKSVSVARSTDGMIRTQAPKVETTQPKTDLESLPANARHNIQRTTPLASKTAPQRSKTLRREVVKRPVGTHESIIIRNQRQHVVVAKSPSISRFAPHPLPRTEVITEPTAQIITHPKPPTTVGHIHKSLSAKKQGATALSNAKQPPQTSRQLKDHLIKEGLAKATKTTAHKPARRKASRTLSVVTACAGLILFAGYLTYLNMPNLSVRVAAAQAGVDAKFPEYRPDGYRFNGPIAYTPGEVVLRFQSNTGQQNYEIKQQSSSWDSRAVLDNYVAKKTASYLTYSEQGLTIYTFNGNAAWVSGGILYTIDGDAPLSSQQVLKIAASM